MFVLRHLLAAKLVKRELMKNPGGDSQWVEGSCRGRENKKSQHDTNTAGITRPSLFSGLT